MAGTLKIPFARGQGMEVLRVSTAMERGVWTFIFPYYYTTNIKTVAFVSECFVRSPRHIARRRSQHRIHRRR